MPQVRPPPAAHPNSAPSDLRFAALRSYVPSQRGHIVAEEFKCCGKEVKRKLEQGVDHETDFKVKVYASGRVSADPETLRTLGKFSERDIHKETGLSRRIIRHIRHKGQVKPSTMKRINDFLSTRLKGAARVVHPKGRKLKTPVR